MNEIIQNIFYPKSIALIGASSKKGSIGYEILNTIDKFKYSGKVFPINPKGKDILGYKCYQALSETPETIDLAIVLVPKKFILDTVEEIIAKKIKSIILITAGFKETGEEGKKLEEEIVDKLKAVGIRVVGPNCMGVVNSLNEVSLNATFVAEQPQSGKIAFLSQSGALGAMILNTLRDTDIRLNQFISVGNKADLSENEFVEFWQDDENIDVITLYLESFENGFEFIKPLMLNEISKPIILLKSGKTKSGMKAASSHTGALSSHDKIVNSLLRQFGIIRVDNVNEMFNTAKGFESFPIASGNKIGVVTNAGGPSILLVDKLEEEGLELAKLSETTKYELRKVVHPEGSVDNPIDLLPGGNEETYYKTIQVLLNDSNIDAVVSLFVEPVMVKPRPIVESINAIESNKPIFQVVMPLPEFWNEYKLQSQSNIPIFKNPEDPAKVLSNILFHKNGLLKRSKYKSSIKKKLESIGSGRFNSNEGYIDQKKAEEICNYYKIPIIKQILVSPENITTQTDLVFPIVVKGVSKDLIHKSEMDAVKLNIKNKSEFEKSVNEISTSFSSKGYKIEMYLIQDFIEPKLELLVGGFKDNSFGPIIMFGTGGKYVEVYDDTQIRSAFISDEEILDMVNMTKIGKILSGVRGEVSVDLDPLINVIQSSARMIIENDKISEFDFNPLVLDKENRLHAVDVRIKFT